MVEALIGVGGTLLGTILGWCLSNIKCNKLIFNIKELHLRNMGDYYKTYFKLNIFNSSDKPKALRNIKICGYINKECVVDSDVEFSPKEGFKSSAEKQEYEAYLRDISLLTINPYESKEESCKIEIVDFEENAKFYLEYNDDKFKPHKIPISVTFIKTRNK